MKTALLTWTLPTTRVDNSPLPISEIKHVEIFISADLGNTYTLLNTVAPSVTQLTVPDLEVGEWRFRNTVVDTLDRRSSNADVTTVVVSDANPSPVTNFEVTLS
jgi:hypothetical protein